MSGKYLHQTGNSLAEYVLPIAVVVLLVATFSFSDLFSNTFQGFMTHQTQGKLSAAKELGVKQFGVLMDTQGNVIDPTAGMEELQENGPSEETVCFGGPNTCLTIPVIAENTDTAGGLGGEEIDKLTSVLEQLPKILEELGVEPTVVDRVSKLANMGHGLADQLREIEGVCKRGKLCTGKESQEAKKQLIAMKKGELGEFMKEYKDLSAYLKDNPNALAAFPEAYGIIDAKAKEINTIVSKLTAQNMYNQVVTQTTKQVTVQCCDGCTWDCKKTVPTTTTVPVFKGLNFNTPGVKKVHQNANSICSQGGDRCYRKV